jgi:hypothetical protein
MGGARPVEIHHRGVSRPTGRVVASLQAAYYAATAIAPLISRRRFEAVTGPKSEWWLVITVSGLVGAIGVSLCLAAIRDEVGAEAAVLGAGSAAALGAIDVVYVARRRIAPVYLLDGAAELALVAAWLAATSRARATNSVTSG